jgi:predicted metal-binding membrane protein
LYLRRVSTAAVPRARLNPISVGAIVLGGALVAWIVTYERMEGMDGGPGTHLGGLGWFLGIWVTMMAAMMLPAAAPMVLTFARVSRHRAELGRAAYVPTWIFLVGYLLAWTGYGLVAYGTYRLIMELDTGFLAWDDGGPWVAGGAIAAAGLYQLTPLKEICLRHCRSPLHFVLHGWKEGRVGALQMGFVHGAYCVGCCWGLMVVLFAVGVMSLTWMAIVAAIIFAEKVLPFGFRLSRALALALITLGAWIAAAPDSVPGLTQPDEAPAMQMGGMEMEEPKAKNEPKMQMEP